MLALHRRLLKWARTYAQRHGAPGWTPAVIRRMVRTTLSRLHRWYHLRLANHALSGRAANFKDVEDFVVEHPVRLALPIVLISQVQRSGGSLLGQLFDGHPEVAAYPHELKFALSVPDRWPQIDPALGPSRNFRRLMDLNFPRFVRRGFTKGDRNPVRHRFLLITRVEYAVFERLWREKPADGPRTILDYYFTSFFNGWLNYQGDLTRKRLITAFAPRFAHFDDNMDRFFECYPEGRLIQVVRDPRSWYPSARKHVQSGLAEKSPEFAADKWCGSARSMLRNRARFGDRVIILRFEDLIGRTEATMRALCGLLGIGYDPVLLEPTFNGQPMRANTSFEVDRAGIIDAPLSRERVLTGEERRMIEALCGALYDEVAAASLVVGAGSEIGVEA